MKIKGGVKLLGLQPQMIICCMVIEQILESYGQELVITSGSDGKHASKKSRHYAGFAIDIRHRDIGSDEDKIKCAEAMRKALGSEYYVLTESTHYHCQYNGSANV